MLKQWRSRLSARAELRLFLGLVSALCLAAIYFWGLGSRGITDGQTQLNAATAYNLIHHSLNLPYDAILVLLKHTGFDSTTWLRSISVLFGLVEIYCFYLILKSWFGRFSAWLGTLFFAATPLFVLVARESYATIVYLYPLIPIAAYVKWVRSKNRIFERWLALVVLAAIAVYQPGGIWFLLLAGYHVRSSLASYIKQLARQQVLLSAGIFVILIIPLIVSLIGASSIIKPLLLIPAGWPSVSDFLKNLGWSVASIFWHSRVHQDLQIGRLAILDAAQDILLIFGIFAMWGRARAKLYVLAVCAGLSIVAASFNSSYNLLLFTLPPIGLVISAGLRYLHLEWISVFPRNPLPRGLAIALLVAVAVVQVIWGAHYALTAWPHSL